MANPVKGEVAFEVEGEPYILTFGINAIIELEEATGRKIDALLPDLAAKKGEDGATVLPDFKLARQVFHAALSDNHDVDAKEAGRLIQKLGLLQAFELLGKAVEAAFPEAAADGSPSPRQRSRKVGTG